MTKLSDSTNESLTKFEKKINELENNATLFWDFEIIKNILFWTAMLSLLLFFGKETLEIYELKVPKIAYKILYPSMFAPLGIFFLVNIGKIIYAIYEKIRYGF